ncbi:MAG: phosphoglycerate kinase [Pseudomonadota bacterium]|nr:phosphoglycerate kinase [Pseudomonadota bacterium]
MPMFKTIDDVDVRNKRVVIRVDLNVPVENGKVTDRTRVDRVAPTIREIADRGAAVLVIAHFDRPKGKVVPEMSLQPVAPVLAQSLGRPVRFVSTDWHDGQAQKAAAAAMPGTITLLENTRYHAGEETNDRDFAALLCSLGDIYVNDAFSAAHRAHASTEAIAHCLPAVAGRAMAAELDALGRALEKPARPLIAIVGGAKISSKLDLLANLTARVDTLVIGGGMANTFLAAQGLSVGKSLCEHDLAQTARSILAGAAGDACTILLPADVVLAREFKAGAAFRVSDISDVHPDEMILDVGPKTVAAVTAAIDGAATLVWNGPLGAFETPPFDRATVACARHAGARTIAGRLVTVAGGGDTVAALNRAGATDEFSYVSTAGGAFLEWLEGKTLPGVKALQSSP